MIKTTFAARLKEAMQIRQVKQVDMVSDLKLPKSAISQYLSGKFEAKQDRVYTIAKYLNVNEAWLMGFDVPMERNKKRPPLKLDLFGGTDENIELLQEINEQVKDNPVNSDDEMDDVMLEIYKRLPEKKRKEALLTLLDLLKK